MIHDLAEFDALAANAPLRSYTWGLDLVGSPTASGGVGALVEIHDHASGLSHFPGYDGNGNILALFDPETGGATARYEYGPFGEPLRVTGGYAAKNPFGFSTKYTDAETGLLYYGYRFYDPVTGRWLSRDPIEEEGSINLYGMVNNNPVNRWDLLGLYDPDDPRFKDPSGNWRDNVIVSSGDITFNIRDYVDNGVTGTVTIGVELYRTGEVRLDYVKLASELRAKGLSEADASAARDALKMEFRAKQTELGRAITQAELKARAQQGHTSSRANPTKTNARINATAKVFKNTGRALAVVGIGFEIYTVAATPEGEMGAEAARAGGRITGGLAGAAALGKVGVVGGPWGVAAGVIIGGIGGSIAGEGAVNLVCPPSEGSPSSP